MPDTQIPQMSAGSLGLGIGGLALGAFGLGYNMWSNNKSRKDSWRMLELQNMREDNAVQRRVADLKAAGLHPTLAAGSAGATTMGTPQQPHHVNTDMINLNLAMAKRQMENLDVNNKLTDAQAEKTRKETEQMDERLGFDRDANRRAEMLARQEVIRLVYGNTNLRLTNEILSETGMTKAELENDLLKLSKEWIPRLNSATTAQQRAQTRAQLANAIQTEFENRQLEKFGVIPKSSILFNTSRDIATVFEGTAKEIITDVKHTGRNVNKFFKDSKQHAKRIRKRFEDFVAPPSQRR